jgi:hypothetical protein
MGGCCHTAGTRSKRAARSTPHRPGQFIGGAGTASSPLRLQKRRRPRGRGRPYPNAANITNWRSRVAKPQACQEKRAPLPRTLARRQAGQPGGLADGSGSSFRAKGGTTTGKAHRMVEHPGGVPEPAPTCYRSQLQQAQRPVSHPCRGADQLLRRYAEVATPNAWRPPASLWQPSGFAESERPDSKAGAESHLAPNTLAF